MQWQIPIQADSIKNKKVLDRPTQIGYITNINERQHMDWEHSASNQTTLNKGDLQIGDIVEYEAWSYKKKYGTCFVVGFDEDGDPSLYRSLTGETVGEFPSLLILLKKAKKSS
jgi:hypothetical protein